MNLLQKICKTCGVQKDQAMFYIKQRINNKIYYSAHCKLCDKIKKKLPENKIKNNARVRERRKQNPSQFREYDKKKRLGYTPDQKLEVASKLKKWRENNPDKVASYRPKKAIQKYSKTYYEKHKELIKQKNSLYKKQNLDKCREWRHNRENKMLGGNISSGIIEKLYLLQKGKCACCKSKLGNKYHLDHIVPISKGGSNTDENVQLLRDICNMNKSAKDPIDYMQSKGYLL